MAHRMVVTDWIPFERFMNSYANLPEILSGGDGLLADGPKFLIEAYANVLVSENLNPSALTPQPAKWWDGRQWAENPAQLVALVLGDSFFVARTLEEENLVRGAG